MHHAIALLVLLVPRGPVEDAILAAEGVRSYDGRLDLNATWTQVAEGVDRVDACRAKVDAAVAAGTAADAELDFRRDDVRGLPVVRKDVSSLRLLRGFCDEREGKVALLRAYLSIKDAERGLRDLERGGRTFPTRLADLAANQRQCSREAATALKSNPAGFAFERPDVKLGEAEEKICKPLAAKVAAARAALPHDPVTLGGDRGRLYGSEALWAEKVYGGSKMPLSKGSDFAHAKVWHVEMADHDPAGNRSWLVRSYRFDGEKLVETKEQSGAGYEAPDAAFF